MAVTGLVEPVKRLLCRADIAPPGHFQGVGLPLVTQIDGRLQRARLRRLALLLQRGQPFRGHRLEGGLQNRGLQPRQEFQAGAGELPAGARRQHPQRREHAAVNRNHGPAHAELFRQGADV